MLIGILLNRVTWEVKQIIEELEKQNIKYKLLNNQKIYFRLTKEKDLLEDFSIILERSLSFFRGLFSAAILETKGYNVINNHECMNLTGNKLLTSLKLIENDIPTPLTCIAYKDEPAIEAIEQVIQYPTIIKPLIGSWGRLIAKLDDNNSAMSNLEAREAMGNVLQKIFYLQKNLTPSNLEAPTDLRVFVVGDKCVAAMGRYNPDRDFRSNIAIGGTAKPVEITKEMEKLSLQASKAVKGEIVGVDLMEDNEKLSVIEVNGTPQFKGVSTATKINIAAEIVDYIIENYR